MTPSSGHQLFSLDTNADFHRCASGKIDARFHDDEVAKMYRLPEIHPVYRRRHDRGTAMPERRNRGTLVHHGQDHAPKHMAQVIGVPGHHELGGLVLAVFDWFEGARHGASGEVVAEKILPQWWTSGLVDWVQRRCCFQPTSPLAH